VGPFYLIDSIHLVGARYSRNPPGIRRRQWHSLSLLLESTSNHVTIGALHYLGRGLLVARIQIAVGSTRRPKLAAVQEAIREFGPILGAGAEFDVVGVEVESGVGHTPADRQELMLGARQRAEVLVRLAREKAERWQYFVGLEGGLDVIGQGDGRRVLLESWAYVSDGRNGHYGRSGGVEVPDALAREVLEHGVELSVAIDRFAGAVGIRDAQGAWGVLSSGLISRTEAFRVAVVAAFAPFYNAKMYHAPSAAR
jgi:inosine/xanthosine triphosphatase